MVKEDPEVRLSGDAPQIQVAIKAAKVLLGMNREHVVMSPGCPRHDRTPMVASSAVVRWRDKMP